MPRMSGLSCPRDCPCSRAQLIFGFLLCCVLAAVLIALAVRAAWRFDATEADGPPGGGVWKVPVTMGVGATYHFTSPNYPQEYPPYRHVEWNFRAPADGALTLTCHHIQLSWFADLYVTDGNFTQRLTCYDCTQAMSYVYEFSSPDVAVGLRNRLFFTGRGFNCTMTVAKAAPDCQCGLANTERIVGGSEPAPHSYPWMAGISLTRSSWIFCGGSLVTDRHVLTAAHCTKNLTAREMSVSLGLHVSYHRPLFRSDVLEVVDHPNFIGDSLINDISVLRIRPVELSEHFKIRPICLPSGAGAYEDRVAIVIGWGTTTYEGEVSPVLLEVPQRIMSNRRCARYYGAQQLVPSMLCAGGILGEDSCQGDSGGPLFLRGSSGAHEVVGLVSYGMQCAVGWPGVYTRVSSFVEWLEPVISEGLQCPPPRV